MPLQYLHTMVRVTNLEESIAFYELLGLTETRRYDNEKGRFTLVFMAAEADAETAQNTKAPLLELTYNWPDAEGRSETYAAGRNFGHLAYRVDDIYEICAHLQANGVTINRPPRDGHMAFVKSPDGISIELLQKGDALTPQEPWKSMQNEGTW